jgi:hypothetical protein
MTQTAQTRCPGCRTILRVPADWMHQPLRCKHCHSVFRAGGEVIGTAPARPGGFVSRPQERRPAYELILALVAVVVVTVLYVYLGHASIPRASGAVGHGFGIVGFLMMLSTETLYSLRKRGRGFTFGRMSTWLQFHIFTGIVGPYLVLLHSGGKFHGLAGVLTLLTVLMVISGFIGRYIYTAVPRTLDGVEVAVRDLEGQIAAADQQLQALGAPALALVNETPRGGWMLVLGRGWLRWRLRLRLHRAVRALGGAGRSKAAQLEQLLQERYRLQMQIDSLAATRRLLALWHLLHMPLGLVLFTLAFVHVGAALYYATLLR